ncbi:hypothetical protein FRC12_022751 [Ceratobasidium sp. 428]|nr:hypothetical protein FRC12_022751 [Ceratobasidium sp. 428]
MSPEDASFSCQAGQKQLTELQQQWLYKTLNNMEQAKIIAKVLQDQVAAVPPTNIVPKLGEAKLPILVAYKKMANKQCKLYRLPIVWLDIYVEGPKHTQEKSKTKYRLVHNFAAINKVTQIREFPMGNLPTMQHKVAEHRWISVLDLMAGFNAIPMAPESVPHTGFYVNSQGYYVYLRMHFREKPNGTCCAWGKPTRQTWRRRWILRTQHT